MIMHDKLFIWQDGAKYRGDRYLRTARYGVLQSVFYNNRYRSDPTAYARFATDDPAMNAAALHLLSELVNEAKAEIN